MFLNFNYSCILFFVCKENDNMTFFYHNTWELALVHLMQGEEKNKLKYRYQYTIVSILC